MATSSKENAIYVEIPLRITSEAPSGYRVDTSRPIQVLSRNEMLLSPEELFREERSLRDYREYVRLKLPAIRDAFVTFLRTHSFHDGSPLYMGKLWEKAGRKPFALPSQPLAQIYDDISGWFAQATGNLEEYYSVPLFVSDETIEQWAKKQASAGIRRAKGEPAKFQMIAAEKLKVREQVLPRLMEKYGISEAAIRSGPGGVGDVFPVFVGKRRVALYIKVGRAGELTHKPQTYEDIGDAYMRVLEEGTLADKTRLRTGAADIQRVTIHRYDPAEGKVREPAFTIAKYGETPQLVTGAVTSKSASPTEELRTRETASGAKSEPIPPSEGTGADAAKSESPSRKEVEKTAKKGAGASTTGGASVPVPARRHARNTRYTWRSEHLIREVRPQGPYRYFVPEAIQARPWGGSAGTTGTAWVPPRRPRTGPETASIVEGEVIEVRPLGAGPGTTGTAWVSPPRLLTGPGTVSAAEEAAKAAGKVGSVVGETSAALESGATSSSRWLRGMKWLKGYGIYAVPAAVILGLIALGSMLRRRSTPPPMEPEIERYRGVHTPAGVRAASELLKQYHESVQASEDLAKRITERIASMR